MAYVVLKKGWFGWSEHSWWRKKSSATSTADSIRKDGGKARVVERTRKLTGPSGKVFTY